MDLSPYQKKKIEDIAARYQLKLVLLFGSQSSSEIHSESDFDIAYLRETPMDFESENRLNYEFTGVFKKDRVDTVDIKKTPPLLFYAIFEHPQVLYAADEFIFPSYQAYAFKKYIETKPLYEEKFRRLGARVSK
ncbi:nucleotidyltransferase domain-containing protein [Candidatus Wolfebacteria bacterium]|nr:nucleotidyltransferase domain-containing protein [Candidatus Wolfebacteria bacterium]